MFWSVGQFVGLVALAIAVGASLVLLVPRAAAWRGRVRMTALVGGLVAWALAPFWAIPDGIGRFDRHPDPTYAYVAQKAYYDAWMHHDNPIQRVAMPGVRVRHVWRDPGHCPRSDPGGREPYADWRAEVRFYTYFGIPGPLLSVACGGWAW